MSDESEIVRLETRLQCAVMTAFRVGRLSAHVVPFPSGAMHCARIGLSEASDIEGKGATLLEAVCDLRDKLRAELVRRRDEHNAAIAMLGSE